MKSLVTLLFFIGPYWVSAQTQFYCRNSAFLEEPLILFYKNNNWWTLDVGNTLCPLDVEVESLTEKNYQGWKQLSQTQVSCFVNTKIKENSRREILQLRLSPRILELNDGFLRITIDNSAAEYGTNTIKTFLKCDLSETLTDRIHKSSF